MSKDDVVDRFKLDLHASEADIHFLEDQINRFNLAQTSLHDFQRLAFVLRDSGDMIVAGIGGWTWGGCCENRI